MAAAAAFLAAAVRLILDPAPRAVLVLGGPGQVRRRLPEAALALVANGCRNVKGRGPPDPVVSPGPGALVPREE